MISRIPSSHGSLARRCPPARTRPEPSATEEDTVELSGPAPRTWTALKLAGLAITVGGSVASVFAGGPGTAVALAFGSWAVGAPMAALGRHKEIYG